MEKRFFQAFSPACDVRDFWHDEQRCYASATVKSTFSGLLLRFRTCRQMPTYLKSELMGKRGAMINDHSLVNAEKSNLPTYRYIYLLLRFHFITTMDFDV